LFNIAHPCGLTFSFLQLGKFKIALHFLFANKNGFFQMDDAQKSRWIM